MFHFEFPPSTGILEVIVPAQPAAHHSSANAGVNHSSVIPVASFADIQIGDYPPTK